jgi:hypothetical protein
MLIAMARSAAPWPQHRSPNGRSEEDQGPRPSPRDELFRDTAHAYAGALSQPAGAIGKLLAIIGRLADAGPEALQDRTAGLKEV